jgi:succinyldiaminopimelate transaminase
VSPGFVPPPYPYDRLSGLADLAEHHEGGMVDCSIGTPCDPPMPQVIDALGSSGLERGYPTSQGSEAYRQAISGWLERRFGVEVDPSQIAGCVGTKEMVASTAHLMALRDPARDVVLYPAVSYPTYAMGATLAGLEPVAVPMEGGHLKLEEVPGDLARRALLIWSNSPSNPTGGLDDLISVAAWGRSHGVVVFSDECYADFTWAGEPRSILEAGLEGVVAVHSLSKRSNLAGVRAGFYTGDPEIVGFLRVVRQHSGLIIPGPIQAAAAIAYGDDAHVAIQRERYLERLELMVSGLVRHGYDAVMPEGAFYLWIPVPERLADGWALADELARAAGLLVSPGVLYGPAGSRFVRLAVVQPTERLALALERLGAS